MKLKCVRSSILGTKNLQGRGAKVLIPIKGLTEGATYTGELVPLVPSTLYGICIEELDIHTMIYNDEQEWKAYPLDLFEPI